MIETNSKIEAAGSAVHCPHIYRTGTLQYTLLGLVSLFTWLLWGDFCYIMLESVVPRLLPLALKDVGASNKLVGIMVGSVAGFMGIVFVPILAVISDRYRGKLGRRIPFLLWASPGTAIFLILIGYAKEVSSLIYGLFAHHVPIFTEAGVALFILCALIFVFQFFNTFMTAMYNCLVADVVPQQVMGRFMSLFRAVGTAGGFVFSRYIFGYAEAYRHEIFLGIAVIYILAFMLMCWRVKEGEYPQISENIRPGIFVSVSSYFKECFTHPLYIQFFLLNTFMGMTYSMQSFYIFFFRDTLALSLDEIGKLIGWIYLMIAVVSVPIGMLCDKIHPVRMNMISVALCAVGHFIMYLFVHDKASLYAVGIIAALPSAAWGISSIASAVILLPKAKFGQFISAMSMIIAIGNIVGNVVAGIFLDWVKDYRMIYVWYVVFELLATGSAVYVFYKWRKLGGSNMYVPPQVQEVESV